jgi:hypothetical protein
MNRSHYRVLLGFTVAACSTPAVNSEYPALLTNPGPSTTLEIEQTISSAMEGAKVSIAEDALTTSSQLTIEQNMIRSIEQQPEMGRNLGRPDHFQLLIDGPQCVLVHEKTGLHWLLNTVECVVE